MVERSDRPTNFKAAPILKRVQFAQFLPAAIGLALAGAHCPAQVDPIDRNLIELAYDQPLSGHGPQAAYAYYYYSRPDFIGPDVALRAAIAPAYADTEMGFKHLLSPTTDAGVGLCGGAFGDNFYDVRQGRYVETRSFYGSGGGAALSLYQLLDPGFLIPLHVIVRGGVRYSSYFHTPETSPNFELPRDQIGAYTRLGLRFAGKQPMLYPDLGLEVSAWFERQRHFRDHSYGFNGDTSITPATDLYWVYAGLNYKFKKSGNKFSFSVTAGGSTNADLFSAWRLGGVLPLVSEFPLEMPGYYYEELTASRFLHLYGSYSIPLDDKHRWELRLEAASARLTYMPGFEQRGDWQTGAGGALAFAPGRKDYRIILRYGYGFNALRHNKEGGQSLGMLFEYDFNARTKKKP